MTTFRNLFRHTIEFEIAILGLGLLILGGFFVVMIPFAFGNDETVHALKADAVAHGELTPIKMETRKTTQDSLINIYGGSVPESLMSLEQAGNRARHTSICTLDNCIKPSSSDISNIREAATTTINTPRKPVDLMGANSYAFIGYIPSALGFGLSHVFDTSTGRAVHLARFTNLLFCIAIICTAFTLVSRSRFRWVVFAIAFLPPVIVAISSLGIDGLLISLSLLLTTCCYRLLTQRQQPQKRVVIVTVITAILLPLLKPPYLLLSLITLFLPLNTSQRKAIYLKTLLAILIIVPALIWNMISADATRTQYLVVHAGNTEPNSSQQMNYIAAHPTEAFTVIAKYFTGQYISSNQEITHQEVLRIPPDFLLVSFLTIFTAIIYSSSTFRLTRTNLFFASAALGACLIIILGTAFMMYLNYNPVGATKLLGMQGRYSLPLFGIGALSLAILLKLNITRVTKLQKYCYMFITIFIPLLTAIWYYGIVY